MVVIKIKYNPMRNHEVLKTQNIEPKYPNIEDDISNTPPCWKISIKNWVSFYRLLLVGKKETHEYYDGNKYPNPEAKDKCVLI